MIFDLSFDLLTWQLQISCLSSSSPRPSVCPSSLVDEPPACSPTRRRPPPARARGPFCSCRPCPWLSSSWSRLHGLQPPQITPLYFVFLPRANIPAASSWICARPGHPTVCRVQLPHSEVGWLDSCCVGFQPSSCFLVQRHVHDRNSSVIISVLRHFADVLMCSA